MPNFEYTLNDEEQTTSEHVLTPREILVNAGIDPDTNYLVEIEGKNQVSYKDKMDDPIHMHEKMKFVAVFTGETPVS